MLCRVATPLCGTCQVSVTSQVSELSRVPVGLPSLCSVALHSLSSGPNLPPLTCPDFLFFPHVVKSLILTPAP